jgi:hypothetical protein
MKTLLEPRPILPTDMPLVRRLAPQGVSLDAALFLTRGAFTFESAVLSAVPLIEHKMPTFVVRGSDCAYVAQFRHRNNDPHAHITFIAPALDVHGESAWLTLLDMMTQAAAKRGALTLQAEVAETGAEFAVLREAGFSVYARQEVWKRDPSPLPKAPNNLLRPATEHDFIGINSLFTNVVPRMIMQSECIPDSGGYVYESKGHILAYVSVQEGRCGYYVQAILHPDTYDQSRAIIASVLSHLPRADRLPVYWPVRRYQEWLNGALTDMGLEAWSAQAVMVKHTVCRIEHPVFKRVTALEGIGARTPAIEYWKNITIRPVNSKTLAREKGVNGISHNRRSGKA